MTVFEAAPKAGGILRYGIAPARLGDALIDEEVNRVEVRDSFVLLLCFSVSLLLCFSASPPPVFRSVSLVLYLSLRNSSPSVALSYGVCVCVQSFLLFPCLKASHHHPPLTL